MKVSSHSILSAQMVVLALVLAQGTDGQHLRQPSHRSLQPAEMPRFIIQCPQGEGPSTFHAKCVSEVASILTAACGAGPKNAKMVRRFPTVSAVAVVASESCAGALEAAIKDAPGFGIEPDLKREAFYLSDSVRDVPKDEIARDDGDFDESNVEHGRKLQTTIRDFVTYGLKMVKVMEFIQCDGKS